jgi:hypothetical protein
VTSQPALRLAFLLATLGLAAAAGCDEQVPGTAGAPVDVAGTTPLTQSQPATPGPHAIQTPERASAPPVATPAPATPVPTVTPIPTPIAPTGSPGASASPQASPSAAASGSPGPYQATGTAGDLAVSGPGYFVLATKPDPLTTEDLLFTRHGKFRLKPEAAGALAIFRLQHADFGFHVVGFTLPGGTAAGAPAETRSDGGATLATTWAGQPVRAAALYLDADRNEEAQTKLAFDYTGRLLVDGAAPRGTDAGPVQAFVAVAQFERPDALVPAAGFAGIYRYAPDAGEVRLGVAVSGAGREVGNANLVLTGQLELP